MASGDTKSARAEHKYLLGAYVVIGFGVLAGWVLWKVVKPHDFVPEPGVSVFALLYIFAQTIERVLEPLTSHIGGAPNPDAGNEGSPKRLSESDAAANLKAAGSKDADKWRTVVAQVTGNRALATWALASFLAMLASGGLGVFLLHAVGLTSVPPAVDILVTGLAIGSGTKPLHDLIGNIQAAKEEKKSNAVT